MIGNNKNCSKMMLLQLMELIIATFTVVQAQDVCNFGNLQYQRGEPLLDEKFQTRCGSTANFPCYCNPDLDPPIDCPYCPFPAQDGTLKCAKDSETLKYTDLNGVGQTCTCLIPPDPSFDPITSCVADEPADNNDDVCVFDLPDGSQRTYSNGQALGAEFTTRCGSVAEFPCYCNPNVRNQIECPYCRYVLNDGNLLCAKDNEVVQFVDLEGDNLQCSCDATNGQNPISQCIAAAPTTPTAPVAAPVAPPVAPPTSIEDTQEKCIMTGPNDEELIYSHGESFGDLLTTRCGSASEFPCYCNVNVKNKIECPYCSFAKSDGTLECAKDDETISYVDLDVQYECSCLYLGPFTDPVKSCEIVAPTAPTPSPTAVSQPVAQPPSNGGLPPVLQQPTQPTVPQPPPSRPPVSEPTQQMTDPPSPTDSETTPGCVSFDNPQRQASFVPDGQPFSELVEGPCGPALEWPTICNLESPSQREYPYCVYTDSITERTICARDGEEITYTTSDGSRTCYCTYLSPLVGAQSTCRQNPEPTSTPTAAPTGRVRGVSTSDATMISIKNMPIMMMASTALLSMTLMYCIMIC